LSHIEEFKNAYHELLGKKYFPCVYVKNETISSTKENYGYECDTISDDRIHAITDDSNFPLLCVSNNFNESECRIILEKILKEIDKESRDEFPYSLQYQREIKLNFWIKYFRNLYFLNLVLLFVPIVI